MKPKQLFIIALFLFLAGACTETINVKLNSTYTRLVVEGSLANDTTPCKVILTKSADYFYNQPVPPLTNATVTIDDGASVWHLKETKPGISGIYRPDELLMGKIGKTYTLHITLNDPINNHSDYTASCKLDTVAHLDSISYEYHPEIGKNGVYIITMYAQEPKELGNYYMFLLYRNGVLWTDSIQKIRLTDDQFINGNYIHGAGVMFVNQSHDWEKLFPGDTIMLQMSGITIEYYNFIQEVQIAGFNIPLFTGPPANVVGNIDNGGIGFFAAYSVSRAKTVIR
jgi:hypothetical protein